MMMLCSDDICVPALFCVATSGMDDTLDSIPGNLSRAYAYPRNLKPIRKRQRKHQAYVNGKTSRLDTESVVEIPENDCMPESSSTLVTDTIGSQQNGQIPLGARVYKKLAPPTFSGEACDSTTTTSQLKNRCDTLLLSRVPKVKASNSLKVATLPNSQLYHKLSLPSNCSQLSIPEQNLLETPKPAVYRSLSTACISSVLKTSSEFQKSRIHSDSTLMYANSMTTCEEAENYANVARNNFSRESLESSPYSSIDEIFVNKPGGGRPLLRSSVSNASPEVRNHDQLQRRRSKSFSNREMLPLPTLSKMEFVNASSGSLNNYMAEVGVLKREIRDKLSSSGSGVSNSSSNSSSSYSLSSASNSPESNASNVNNVNLIRENKSALKSDKKLKNRRKLKGSKSLSKSLHSLLPMGCSGSLTLNHDHSFDETNPESIYQQMPQTLTEFRKIEHQETEYIPTENHFHDQSTKNDRKNAVTLGVLKSYAKWKTSKPRRPVISDPIATVWPNTPCTTKSNKTLPTNLSSSKDKSKSAKSLRKSSILSCVATKDLWYNKLAQVIAEEKESTPPTTNIQVSYYDPNTSADICKTVTVTSNTNARECINLILDHLEMRDADVTKFQLWVKSSLEDSPYPLIGHEFPFAIKYNCMRETMQDCDAEQCNNLYNNGSHSSGADVKCQFILRQERKPGLDGLNADSKKVSKKARKSPIRIHNVFKRSNSKGDSIDGAGPAPPGILFGHSLGKLFAANGSALPKPIMDMLMQLFQKGPFTVGIFRKSANARLVRELREKLDSGCPSDLSSTNITAVAAILKEFLRSLPDSLLCSQFYDEWLEIPSLSSVRDQISHTLLLCSRLPRANLLLLQHFLCILHHIARRSSQNMMPPSNLAVCVGPSLLWPSSPIVAFNPETSKQAPSVIEFLIERFGEVFGEAMLRIMGDPPEQDSARQDSGAEESDSLHSGHSLHSCNGRRDDSSIDSLERDLEGELSPLPRKDKMSLTNLSRDSGLTMSDTQLYTPDEEESESTSSGHSSGDKNAPYPDHRNVERVQHYPAPNNPNAIYTAVCRRSDKSNGYDEHENYYATPSREHTRVHITYSTPNYAVGNKDYSLQTYSPERLGDNSRMTYENDSIYSVPSTDPSHKQVLEIENVNSNFQRDDPMRRKSNLRKAYKTNNVEHGLIRTTSEESLLSKYNNHEYGMSLGASGTTNLRSPSAERTRSPATIEYDDSANFITRDSPLRRSRSAHYLAEVRKEKLKDNSENLMSISRSASQDTVSWLRSRSASNIQDEVDRSYDSSTLSDDDSTPHVSRSNSRGKECGSGSNGHWDPQTPSDSGNSRNSSFKSERTGSVCTVISAGSCSTLSSNPPSYEEALNRRSIMLQHQQQQNSGSPSQFNDHSIREEKVKSARAKKLYADSLRLYQEEKVFGDIVRASPAHTLDVDEVDCPPPLPPKGDPPPLPPKQRSSRRMSSENSNKLKHLPPVHVETTSRKKQTSHSLNSSVGPTMHKTIIYTDVGPPNLPPKERTVIEVVESTNDRDRTVRTVAQPVVEKKSIETQTDDCDLDDDDDIRDDDSPTSDAWMSDHVTSVQVPDSTYNNYNINSVSASSNGNSKSSTKRSRGRPRRRDSSASQRSRSVPSRDSAIHPSSSDSEDDEWEFPHEYPGAVNYGLRDFANYEPELRQEISWSVSQLRAIFGESLKGAKVHPPPYRPPPVAGRAPITSYHLGAKDNFCRKSSRPQSSYGEESYV